MIYKSWKQAFCSLAFVAIVFSLSGVADAVEGPHYDQSFWTKRTRKLIRGGGNLVFGFVEIPVAINEEWQNLDPFTGTFVGGFKGAFRGLCRTGAGALEIVTFPFGFPRRDFKPLMTPEQVMQEDTGKEKRDSWWHWRGFGRHD